MAPVQESFRPAVQVQYLAVSSCSHCPDTIRARRETAPAQELVRSAVQIQYRAGSSCSHCPGANPVRREMVLAQEFSQPAVRIQYLVASSFRPCPDMRSGSREQGPAQVPVGPAVRTRKPPTRRRCCPRRTSSMAGQIHRQVLLWICPTHLGVVARTGGVLQIVSGHHMESASTRR